MYRRHVLAGHWLLQGDRSWAAVPIGSAVQLAIAMLVLNVGLGAQPHPTTAPVDSPL